MKRKEQLSRHMVSDGTVTTPGVGRLCVVHAAAVYFKVPLNKPRPVGNAGDRFLVRKESKHLTVAKTTLLFSGAPGFSWRSSHEHGCSLECDIQVKLIQSPTLLDCPLQRKCDLKHPPGDEIYRNGSISMFEVSAGYLAELVSCVKWC